MPDDFFIPVSPKTPVLPDEPTDSRIPGEKLYSECAPASTAPGRTSWLSLINNSPEEISGQIRMRLSTGVLTAIRTFTLSAYRRIDLNVEELGLTSGAEGLVCAETKQRDLSKWFGHVFTTKASLTNPSSYDFALHYPLALSQNGESFVPINTNYAGVKNFEQWFHILDGEAGDGVALSGAALMYSNAGKLLSSVRVSVPDGGRTDVPIHGAYLKKIRSGVARFVPDSGLGSEQYHIAGSRLFPSCQSGSACNSYIAGYALPISETILSGAAVGSASEMRGEKGTIEFHNVTGKRIRSALRVMNFTGTRLGAVRVSVAGFGATLTSYTKTEKAGFVPQKSEATLSFVKVGKQLRSVGTFARYQGKKLLYAFPRPFFAPGNISQVVPFDSRFGQVNNLELTNRQTKKAEVTLEVRNSDGVVVQKKKLTLKPLQSLRTRMKLPAEQTGVIVAYHSSKLPSRHTLVVANYVNRKSDFVTVYGGK